MDHENDATAVSLFKDETKQTCILTRAGIQFDLLAPRAQDVVFEDFAIGLAREGRFSGQTTGQNAYTVAEHCCRIHDAMEKDDYSPNYCLAGLIHDAAEGYTGDFPRPLKLLLPKLYEIEDAILEKICERYNIAFTQHMKKIVKEYDNRMCMQEALHQMVDGGTNWNWGDLEPLGQHIACWDEHVALEEFRWRFGKYRDPA